MTKKYMPPQMADIDQSETVDLWKSDPENCLFQANMGYDHWEAWLMYKGRKKTLIEISQDKEMIEGLVKELNLLNDKKIQELRRKRNGIA